MLRVMSTDTKWIIGTGIAVITAIVGTGGVLAGLMLTQIGAMNARIDDMRADMRADMREIRATLERFDARLDAIEVALAKLDQRLLTIERVVLPAAESGE